MPASAAPRARHLRRCRPRLSWRSGASSLSLHFRIGLRIPLRRHPREPRDRIPFDLEHEGHAAHADGPKGRRILCREWFALVGSDTWATDGESVTSHRNQLFVAARRALVKTSEAL